MSPVPRVVVGTGRPEPREPEPAPVAPVVEPVEAATYLLRDVDAATWEQFKARAKADGVTARGALLQLIAAYTRGDVTLSARPS